MHNIRHTLSALLLLMFSLHAAAGQKADTLVVTPTPKMSCENCVKKIKQNIRFVKGTKSIAVSLPEQTVTIVYDKEKSHYEDFVAAFRKIGYRVEKVSATRL
mgnify:FL=1